MGIEAAVIGVSSGVLGLVLGALAGYLVRGRDAQVREGELQSEVGELRDSFDTHKRKVTKHFERSSDLFRDLTRHYVSLYSHLADGAREFCSENSPSMRAELRALLEAGEPEVADRSSVSSNDHTAPHPAPAAAGGLQPQVDGSIPACGGPMVGAPGSWDPNAVPPGAPLSGPASSGPAAPPSPGPAAGRPMRPAVPGESISAFLARVEARAAGESDREHHSGYRWTSSAERWSAPPADIAAHDPEHVRPGDRSRCEPDDLLEDETDRSRRAETGHCGDRIAERRQRTSRSRHAA